MTRTIYVILATLSLLVVLMSWRVLWQPMVQAMPHVVHFLANTAPALWAHVVLGPLVLVLALVQLWTGLRQRWPGLHRMSGRLYVMAVLVAAPSGFALAASADSQASDFARIGFMVLALGWLGTTGMGLVRALRGDMAAHRWWMQRSLALTFAAVTLRLMMGPLIAGGWTVAETYDVTAWGSWIVNLALLEWWQRRRIAALAG